MNKDTKTSPAEPPAPEGGVTPTDGMRKIKPVDLALHSDGISHWQDEPQEEPREAAETADEDAPASKASTAKGGN